MINYFEPSVVVIDDIKGEVSGILDFYSSKGIGCRYFNADPISGEIMPETQFVDVNLIYLDLIYTEKFDAEQSCNWIRSIINEKSFYVIVFWTKDISNAESVLALLEKHNRTPFLFFNEQKSDYKDDVEYNFDSLVNKIQDSCLATPAIEEILLWKKSIKLSANEVLGHLAKNPSNIVDKLIKLISSLGGENSISEFDENQKRNILFDALDKVLTSNTKNRDLEVVSDLNKDKFYNLPVNDSVDPDKELNSWFHFNLQSKIGSSYVIPGLICEFPNTTLCADYYIDDDKKVGEYIKNQIDDGGITISKIALVLSRPCDIAQKKFGKNIKLLSGLKFVNPIRKTNGKKEFKGNNNPSSSFKIYDHLYFSEDEKDVTLMFDFRYSFSVPVETFKNEFKNIKIFNKELLSEIQVEYSSYSSKLGITTII